MENNIGIQLKTLCYKYNRRIFNKKNFVQMLLLFVAINIYVSPIKDFSVMTNYKVTPWVYPFLISDANFLAMFIAEVVYYFSNVPFMQKSNSYYLIREGRKKWIMEQLMYIVLSAFVITGISIVLSIIALMPYVVFEADWGNVLFTLARTDAGSMVKMFWNISIHFIRNYSPISGMGLSMLLTVIGITFIGMLMFFISIYVNRTASVVVSTVLILYSAVVANIGNTFEKSFAMFSPVSWLRVTRIDVVEYGFSVSPSITYIIICFLGLILFLNILIWKRCKKIDFIWENEDE